MLRDLHLQRLGNRLTFHKRPVVEPESIAEDEPHPLLMWYWISPPLLHSLQPVPILLPQQPRVLRVVRLQAGIECLHQHREAEERTRDRHEREPFGMVAGDGHG